jgi:hypothetical protein
MGDALPSRAAPEATTAPTADEGVRRHIFGRLMVDHPGGSTSEGDVTTELITPTNITVIYPGFVYPGSATRLHVTGVGAHESLAIAGVVRSCTHVQRSKHRLVIALEQQINPKTLLPVDMDLGADDWSHLSGRLLLLDAEEASWRLIKRFLADTMIDVHVCQSIGPALDFVKREHADLLIISGTHWSDASGDAMRHLRSAGFNGQAIIISAGRADATPAGAALRLQPPPRQDRLLEAIDSLLGARGDESLVHSACSDEPTIAPMLEWYCSHVRERVHELWRLEGEAGARRAEQICQTLRDTAPGYGYPELRRLAEIARITLLTCGALADARDDLMAIDDLARRMRP